MDLFSICVGLLLLLVSNVSVLAFTLALSPVLVPVYMVHGEDLFVDESDYEENPHKMCFYGGTFKRTVKLSYWLFCPIWFLPKILYDKCTNRNNDSNQMPITVNTVTQQVPHETTHQTVTTQPRIDSEVANIQMTILESELADMRQEIDQMKRVQNQPVESVQPYSRQPSDEPRSNALECLICFMNMHTEGRHQVVFNPCGHSCCNQCASRVNNCHQCRSSISTKIRVY